MKEFQPVTISVITYNSSKYVVETLNSIKAQTYPNLILLVCDDCSTDNTVELCKKWIATNQGRFVSTKIICHQHNTGISASINRAWDACETQYIKGIAGDDILFPNCIEDNIRFVEENPEAILVFSKAKAFGSYAKRVSQFNSRQDDTFYSLSIEDQRKLMQKVNPVVSPTNFVNIKKARELGLRHDERIPMIEDYPLYLNALNKGERLYYFPKVTVGYRITGNSISISRIPSQSFNESLRLIYFLYEFEYTKNNEVIAKQIVDSEKELIKAWIKAKKEVNEVYSSNSYRLGHALLWPLIQIKKLFE